MNDKPDPGAGHRLLEFGEILLDGDEFFHPPSGEWLASDFKGVRVGEFSSVYRRLELAKPPLGLRPRAVVDAKRLAEVVAAIHRYIEAGKDIPSAWVKEFIELSA